MNETINTPYSSKKLKHIIDLFNNMKPDVPSLNCPKCLHDTYPNVESITSRGIGCSSCDNILIKTINITDSAVFRVKDMFSSRGAKCLNSPETIIADLSKFHLIGRDTHYEENALISPCHGFAALQSNDGTESKKYFLVDLSMPTTYEGPNCKYITFNDIDYELQVPFYKEYDGEEMEFIYEKYFLMRTRTLKIDKILSRVKHDN